MQANTDKYALRPVGRWAIYTALVVLPLAAIPVVLAVRDGMALSGVLPTLLFVDACVCSFPGAIAMLASLPLLLVKKTRGIGANFMAYGAALGVIIFGTFLFVWVLTWLGLGQIGGPQLSSIR